MKRKKNKAAILGVAAASFLLLALGFGLALHGLLGSDSALRASSFRVAVKNVTAGREDLKPDELRPVSPADLPLIALPKELLEPVTPGLRVTAHDIDKPPEVGVREEQVETVGPYEEKRAVPETPIPSRAGAKVGRPRLAIIIDDVGLRAADVERLSVLPAAVTFSFLPYGIHLQAQADKAKAAGHELLLHLPMEPVGGENPGEGALLTKLSDEENGMRLEKALNSFTGFDGVNNHMGSRFTSQAERMKPVLEKIAARGLFFLDSRTSGKSIGNETAAAIGMPHLKRDVFIDDEVKAEPIRAQLEKAERIARARGYAVLIGHPHGETIRQLQDWTKEAATRGFDLVPVKRILEEQDRRVTP